MARNFDARYKIVARDEAGDTGTLFDPQVKVRHSFGLENGGNNILRFASYLKGADFERTKLHVIEWKYLHCPA